MNIEFDGKVNQKCIETVGKHLFRKALTVMLCFEVPVIAFLIMWCILFSRYRIIYIVAICVNVIIICVFIVMINAEYRRRLKKYAPTKVSFQGNVLITQCEESSKNYEGDISKVKRILDFEDCYYIKIPLTEAQIICQKSLLSVGTIDEFESAFSGKIVKCRG